MHRYALNGEAEKARLIGQSLSRMYLGWMHERLDVHRHIRRTLLRAIIHEDAFGPEENGADRISSVRSVWLVPDGKPRARDYDAIRFSLLAVALLLMPSETQGFPRGCHYPDKYQRRVPKATSAEMGRTFESWRGTRAHPEISRCHSFVEIRSSVSDTSRGSPWTK